MWATNKKFRASLLKHAATAGLGLAASAVIASSGALAADSLLDAFKQGKPLLDVRYSYENVDQDGFARNAKASTLRTRFGFETAEFMHLKFMIEDENITNIGSAKYNSTTNGRTQFPVVADPETTEINQAKVTLSALPQTTLIGGRQIITLDNHRFIGNVGWRQNIQTFDAVRLINKSLPDTVINYAYIGQVNRIFGKESAVGRFTGDTHAINIAYNGLPFGKLVGYGYWVDINQAAALSSRTLGGYFAGKSKVANSFSILYRAEWAHQTDYKANPFNFGLDYYMLQGGVAGAGFVAKMTYEVLEGNGTASFKTPLATLHKWQGFADVFLVTPPDGIEDLYGMASYTFKPGNIAFLKSIKLAAWYHDFSSENTSQNLGNETDLLLAFKFSQGVSALVKYADYSGKGFAASRQKLWLRLAFKI